MNVEIEVKVKIKDIKQIKSRLKKLGAKYLGTLKQIDTYFLIKQSDRFRSAPRLRVRQDLIGKKARLEYHEPKDKLTTHEFELEINDAKTAETILKRLGLARETAIQKTRLEYKLGKMNIVLDDVKGLGKFIEVEIINGKRSESKKRIFELLDKLGVDRKNVMDNGYLHMIWEKMKKKL